MSTTRSSRPRRPRRPWTARRIAELIAVAALGVLAAAQTRPSPLPEWALQWLGLLGTVAGMLAPQLELGKPGGTRHEDAPP